MSDFDAAPTEDHDISLAIAALYGVTSRTSGNIPQLLLNLDKGTLFYLAGLKLLDEAKSEDGTPCLRLQGVDFSGEENTIWIGKDDLLIRKIETVKDPANRDTTIYKPTVNAEITDGELVFRKPEARN
jgi:outer membrane lipoprotein-sorting protein